MSINYQYDLNEAGRDFMEELFGSAMTHDGKQFLYDKLNSVSQADMTELANKAQQPVTVEIHSEGEIKTMADGTQYKVTKRGWVRV